MSSASGSQDIPVNIDPNAWTVVLRNGVPTLIPRQQTQQLPLGPQQPARLELEAPPNQVGQPSLPLLDKEAYENALALHYASQPGALNPDQHVFLKTRLKNLRKELDKYDQLVDQRLVHENVQGSQVEYMPAPGSRNNQTTPTTSYQQYTADQLRALEAMNATRREALARELAQQSNRRQAPLRDGMAQPQIFMSEIPSHQTTHQQTRASTSVPAYASAPPASQPVAYVRFNQQDMSRHQAYLQELQSMIASNGIPNGTAGRNVVPAPAAQPSTSRVSQPVRQPTQSSSKTQQPVNQVNTSQQPRYQFVMQPSSNVAQPATTQPGISNIPMQSDSRIVNSNWPRSGATSQPLQTAVHIQDVRISRQPVTLTQTAASYAPSNLIIPMSQASNSNAETHAHISPVSSPEKPAPAANTVPLNHGQAARIHPHSTTDINPVPTQFPVTGLSLPSKTVDKPTQHVPQQGPTQQNPVD
ncbi:13861_t:CDS:2, partial [Acaulospora colombiana]